MSIRNRRIQCKKNFDDNSIVAQVRTFFVNGISGNVMKIHFFGIQVQTVIFRNVEYISKIMAVTRSILTFFNRQCIVSGSPDGSKISSLSLISLVEPGIPLVIFNVFLRFYF